MVRIKENKAVFFKGNTVHLIKGNTLEETSEIVKLYPNLFEKVETTLLVEEPVSVLKVEEEPVSVLEEEPKPVKRRGRKKLSK